MQNYSKQHLDFFCPVQIFILGSESHVQLNTGLYRSKVRVSPNLIPKIRGFEYFRISIQSLENEIQVEE
ncbi:hypothetical protein BH23THE1_BH23THE1_25040 [soil metagenome]